MWKPSELTDKPRILSFLETDRFYAAYAIGDLEAGMFEQCTWTGAEKAGRLAALALLFRGLMPPALFVMGHADGIQAIFEEVLHPEQVYLACGAEHLLAVRGYYRSDRLIPMWRMVLQPHRFRPIQGGCIRLFPSHSSLLAELYALGGGDAFDFTQLQKGVFYGVLINGHLVAAAGTHLSSPTYDVAAVGNVFTHPDHRGRGYGSATTSAVIAELYQRGIRDIVLNVDQENMTAIHVYERLGFQCYCPFLEGLAVALQDRQSAEPP
jgi:ribosomal protein S18 acetylase RimI-like enzyme